MMGFDPGILKKGKVGKEFVFQNTALYELLRQG